MLKNAAVLFTILMAANLLLFLTSRVSADPIVKKPFGATADGQPVDEFILTNSKGSTASVITYGAIVTELWVPDKNGKLGDVVLGFDSVKQYEESGPFIGCIAGRYANRIAKGMFTLDGIRYALPLNNGPNTLHGGFKGLAKRVWQADAGVTPDGPTVRLTILDPDDAEGFPGNLRVTVLYTLTQADALKVQYFATTDKATPINLTHHGYFNLTDLGKGEVLNYVARIHAAHYLPVDSTLIPTGEITAVEGTPFDFTRAKTMGHDLKATGAVPPGYDHTMILNNKPADLALAAEVYDPASGRLLECWTTEPAVHFYTGNGIGALAGKRGIVYGPYRAFCLETQHFPDSPNHPNFPSTILHPGEVYRQITEFHFSVPAKPLEAGQ